MKMARSGAIDNLFSEIDGLWFFPDYVQVARPRADHWVLLDSAQVPAPSGKVLIASANLVRRGRTLELSIHVKERPE